MKSLIKLLKIRRRFGYVPQHWKLIDFPFDARICFGKNVKFEGSCYLGENLFIDARGSLSIGNNVIFGPSVTVLTYEHQLDPNYLPYGPGIIKKPVKIGNNVWLGFGSIILGGAEIGSNSIIGAGSVVKGKIESNSIYAGNPAKRLRELVFTDSAEEYQTKQSMKNRWG